MTAGRMLETHDLCFFLCQYAVLLRAGTQKIASIHVKVIVTIQRFDIAVAEHYALLSSAACITCYQARSETDTHILTSDTHTHTHTGMRRVTTFRSTTDRIYDGGPIRL